MNKVNKTIGRLCIIVVHFIGLLFIEIQCAAKLVWHVDWTLGRDVILVLSVGIWLMIHYSFLHLLRNKNVLSHGMITILTGMDTLLTGGVIAFLVFPNPVINKPVVSVHIFIIAIQVAILIARILFFQKLKLRTQF